MDNGLGEGGEAIAALLLEQREGTDAANHRRQSAVDATELPRRGLGHGPEVRTLEGQQAQFGAERPGTGEAA